MNTEQQLKLKWKILEQINQDKKDNFAIFYQSEVGKLPLGQCSLSLLQELVTKFINSPMGKSRLEEYNPHEKTYYEYQSVDPNQAENLSKKIKEQSEQFSKQEKQYKQQTPKVEKSAIELVDDFFQNVSKESSSPNNNKKQKKQVATSLIENNDFWKIQNLPSKKHQPLKKNQFIEFDILINNQTTSNQPKNSQYQQINQAFYKTERIPVKNIHVNKTHSPQSKALSKTQQIKIKQIKELSQISLTDRQKKICNKIPYQGNIIFKEKFEDTISCYKTAIRVAFSHPNLKVTVPKHQIIHRSFFSPDYVMYTIKIQPSGLQCKRNYQDFTKLREALNRVYPGHQLPYLQKNSWLSQTNSEFIKKQKVMLQYFLDDLLSNKQIRNSRILQDFLTLQQHKKIKRRFQQFQKMDKQIGIQQLCLLQGKVNIRITQEHRVYQQKGYNFVDQMDQYLERHRKLLQTLTYQYQCILVTLTSLSDLMKQSIRAANDFNNRVSIQQIPKLSESFKLLLNLYKEQYSKHQFNLNLINRQLLPFIKYEASNLQTIRQVLGVSNQMTKRYLKKLQIQSPTSNQPYSSEKLKHYKLGILQESKNMFVFKYQVGFINNQACTQFKRFFDQISYKLKIKCSTIAKQQQAKLKQSLDFWRTLNI